MESAVPHPAEALGRTRLSRHLSFPGACAPRLCPAVRPRVRLGPSISHRQLPWKPQKEAASADLAVSCTEARAWSCQIRSASGWETSAGPCSVTPAGPGQSTARVRVSGRDNEMVSSLGLQMSLYFNTYFFPLWWISSIMMLQMKYSILPDYYKFIVVTVIILITLIEAIRLYLGYMGNLQEKVPELAGFWLLSLLLQLPLILFLLFNEGLTNLPLEKAIHIIFTLFLTFQVVSAFLTLRKMVNQLATRFHLQDFDRLSAYRGGMRRMRSCIEEI
ncbi:transmembrane protein 17 isoform X1 [Lutra lutra]|uniref:transmembrane protein 17 isoform X1 n=1 Tax=Lutra lutra TaxID=9657 RepID=UPI001FD50ACE|nr:transmembrane protein 17 isoform X1 [Lutra lutra]